MYFIYENLNELKMSVERLHKYLKYKTSKESYQLAV